MKSIGTYRRLVSAAPTTAGVDAHGMRLTIVVAFTVLAAGCSREPNTQSVDGGSSSTPRMVKVGWDPPEVPAQPLSGVRRRSLGAGTLDAGGGRRVQMPGGVGAGTAGPARCEGSRVRSRGPVECPGDADRSVTSGSRFAFEIRLADQECVPALSVPAAPRGGLDDGPPEADVIVIVEPHALTTTRTVPEIAWLWALCSPPIVHLPL